MYMLEITTSARNINSITTMYGNTKVTPAVCGLHGNFYFIHFDYQENKYEIEGYLLVILRGVIFIIHSFQHDGL